MRTILIIFLTVFLHACSAEHNFKSGQCVKTKIDNLKGMVVMTTKHNVWVRFSVISERTNTHILGSDGDIEKAPYAIVSMKHFELELNNCEMRK